jgi:hypothetical protein
MKIVFMKPINAALMLGVILNFMPQASSAVDTSLREPLSISVTNKYGDVFTNLVVAKILSDGLVLEHKAGQLKVKYADLPQDLRQKYQQLGAVAEDKEKQDAAGNAAYVAIQRQAQAEQARLKALREQQPPAQQPAAIGKSKIEIFKQGWAITVLNPGLKELGKHLSDAQFAYQAIGPNGFNLSIWVETPAGGGMANNDVFNYYWAKAGRNPLINEKSIKTQVLGKFVKVSYTSLNIPNVNYYFAFKGRWVDVHISKSRFTKGDEKFFADFEEVLSYED